MSGRPWQRGSWRSLTHEVELRRAAEDACCSLCSLQCPLSTGAASCSAGQGDVGEAGVLPHACEVGRADCGPVAYVAPPTRAQAQPRVNTRSRCLDIAVCLLG
jgi:hypothetical protein